jgi:hypothetical protein
VVTDGNAGNFQQIFEINTSKLRKNHGWTLLSILGASVSVMFTPYQNWEGQSGYIVEVDSLNKMTGQKELRIKKCSIISSKGQSCKIMVTEVILLLDLQSDIDLYKNECDKLEKGASK